MQPQICKLKTENGILVLQYGMRSIDHLVN